MKKTTKTALIVAAVVVTGIVLFNLLRYTYFLDDIRWSGDGDCIIVKAWWDSKTK